MAKRILVVEDDEKSRRLLRDVLTYHGYAVDVAHTGEEALRAVRAARPDAALLDIQLPGLNGFEVLKALRALVGARPWTTTGRGSSRRDSMHTWRNRLTFVNSWPP
jgi:DNA-binding response OmpR family regulator